MFSAREDIIRYLAPTLPCPWRYFWVINSQTREDLTRYFVCGIYPAITTTRRRHHCTAWRWARVINWQTREGLARYLICRIFLAVIIHWQRYPCTTSRHPWVTNSQTRVGMTYCLVCGMPPESTSIAKLDEIERNRNTRVLLFITSTWHSLHVSSW